MRLLIALPALSLVACAGTLDLEDAWNYGIATDVQADTVAVADCPDDVSIDWSGLTVDLQGHAMDPSADLTSIEVTRFLEGYDQAAFLEDLSVGLRPDQSVVSGTGSYAITGGETAAMLSEFTYDGTTPVDPGTELCSTYGETFLLTAKTGSYAYRTLLFAEPTAGEANTEVFIDSDSATLSVDADLHTAPTIPASGKAGQVVTWMGLEADAYGNPISHSNIDLILLARYTQSIDELEGQFLDLWTIADEMYSAEFQGLGEIAMSEAVDADGNAFEGFSGDGTWLLGLFCSTCANPAPYFMGVVEQ